MAILWGSINEEGTLVTNLEKFLGKNTGNLIIRETGGFSPDESIDFNERRKTVLGIKFPFIGGKPVP